MATRSVRARYRNGVLEPLEAVDLSEDQEVLLTLDDEQQAPSDQDSLSKSAGVWADMFEDDEQKLPTDREAFVQAAGGWVGQFDDYQALIREIYQARIDGTRPSRYP